MLSSLATCDGFWTGLGIVHFRRYLFAIPGRFYAGEYGTNIVRSFANLGGIEDDVVVVEVETEGDVELFTNWQKVVDGPGDVVVFKDEATLDTF
jgi:hypothetical protein